jgi:hypothetical protein
MEANTVDASERFPKMTCFGFGSSFTRFGATIISVRESLMWIAHEIDHFQLVIVRKILSANRSEVSQCSNGVWRIASVKLEASQRNIKPSKSPQDLMAVDQSVWASCPAAHIDSTEWLPLSLCGGSKPGSFPATKH